jgi:hypothetical protein
MNTGITIPKKHQLLFWLILAAFSTYFAEVFSGSDMFPFFHAWGLLVVVPLYGLHILLLGSLVFREGGPRFSSLVFAGMIFGLYEAYLTKVLWDPPWGGALIVADVAPIETLVLVFWWHTWFSFIIPLLVAEKLFSDSTSLGRSIPGKLGVFLNSWSGLASLMVFGGLFQSINSPSLTQSLLSGLTTTGVLTGLALLWKRTTRGASYSLVNLLPDRKQFQRLLIPTGILYLALGILIRPEAYPGFPGHLMIWILYAGAIYLLLRSLNLPIPSPEKRQLEKWSGKRWLILAAIFPLAAAAGELLLTGIAEPLALIFWLGGILFGLSTFIKALRQTFPGVKKVEKAGT